MESLPQRKVRFTIIREELNKKMQKITALQKIICVIDDEEGIRDEMREWLIDFGYRVVIASNGEEGLQQIREWKPDLIICDVIMPKLNGLEVLREIKRDKKTASIPVIMLTAKTDSPTILQSQELRAADFFMKPFDSKELLEAIQKYI